MKLLNREAERRIMALEAFQAEEKRALEALGERVRLIYTDGHMEEVRETHRVKVKEVEAATDWFSYVDGYSNRVPELLKVEYLDSGKIWDFEAEARRPPLTKDEIQEITHEIEEEVKKKERRGFFK